MSKAADAAPRAPYKLFDYYTFNDRDLFFGREEEVLRTVGEVLSTRLLVLFAPSGSGKSSLLNAGVRPRLEERGFITATVRLDTAPELAVKKRLREKFPHWFGGLTDSTDLHAGLTKAYAPKTGTPGPKPLALFLDPFEEFFIAWRGQPAVRQAFIRQLAQIKFDNGLPVYLVISLRDDYFVHLNEFREEIPSIFHNNANIQLRPLSDDAALRAIVEPARAAGLEYEPGLPEWMIQDLKALHQRSAPTTRTEIPPDDNPEEAEATDGAPAGSTADDPGVLPITLQIVCHKLWEKRPADGGPITHRLYAGDKAAGGLGGAAAIIRRQLDESLAQIPRSDYPLMRRLFRVLMTTDQTKRLRSIDDLAEILRLPDRQKLERLLTNLTRVSVLSEEHHEQQAWYEFRHDYLVKEVAGWLGRCETRLRRRRQLVAWMLGVLPAMGILGVALWSFLTIDVRFTAKEYEGQEEELYLTRRFNPLDFKITTGFRRDEVMDLNQQNRIAGAHGVRFARPQDWRPLTNMLSGFSAARLGLLVDERSPVSPRPLETIATLEAVDDVVLLVRQHPPLLRAVLECLRSAAPPIRQTAAAALIQLSKGDAAVGLGLLTALQDPDPGVRARAAITLGQLGRGDGAVAQGLLAALKDRDAEVRAHAAAALGQMEAADAAVLDGLLAALADPSQEVRLTAGEALILLGDGGETLVRTLAPGLKDGEAEVRLRTAVALGRLGKADAAVRGEFLALLGHSNTAIRLRSAQALGQLGQTDAAVMQALLALLRDNDTEVRLAGAEALAQASKYDERVVTGLLALLKDTDADVRQRATDLLGHVGKGNATAVAGLLALLTDTSPPVRQSAAEALGRLGTAEPAVTEGLLAALRDADNRVRESAALALGQLGTANAAVTEGLLNLLRDGDKQVRLRAAAALGQLGKTEGPITAGLLALLTDADKYVRLTAAEALARLAQVNLKVVECLLPLLKDGYTDVRQRAAVALGQTGEVGKKEVAVVEALLASLKDKDRDVRQSAAASLVRLGEGNSVVGEGLVALLGEGNRYLRLTAAEALIKLGNGDATVVQALMALLKDSTPYVRQSAAEALGLLGQNRTDWTDERLLLLIQDDLSGWRKTAGMVLANRRHLKPATYEQVVALRHDARPWVRLAAWDALLEIERVRAQRQNAAPNPAAKR